MKNKNTNKRNNKNKLIYLVIAVVLIVLAISFLEKKLSSSGEQINNFNSVAEKESKYQRAIELPEGSGYINTNSSLRLSSLVGNKVVLIDFWTYSCINCLRTVPYLSSWYGKYKDKGLEIISVHTPEFSFEKDYSNVAAAVKRLGISYPVILDNNYSIWNAYNNKYWPGEYLIDSDGYVVETHFGEGDYNTTEDTIIKLLEERANKLNISMNASISESVPFNEIPINFSLVRSPETYFGANRNTFLANGIAGKKGVQTNLSLPDKNLSYNKLYLIGSWNISSEYASPLDSNSKVLYGFDSKNMYVVASSTQNKTINAILDSKYVASIKIGQHNIYGIFLGDNYAPHSIELTNLSKDMQFYTFTFG